MTMARDFAPYDTRHYETLTIRDGYASWAALYDAQLADGNLDLVLLERLRTIDWSRSQAAVDLACGTGRTGAWLVGHGAAAVHGVDITPEMLAVAEARNIYRSLRCEDIRATSLDTASADLVVSSLAVGHLPALAPFYGEADRLLAPGGWMVVVGYHPFFLLSGIPTHFKDGQGINRAIQNYIHLLGDHVAATTPLGWNLVEMHERVVNDAWIAGAPGWQHHAGKPVSFAMAWRKPSWPGQG